MQCTASEIHESPDIFQLSCGMEKSNTYIVADRGHAIVVDVCSKDVVRELESRKLIPDFVLLTHEHVDHLWGLNSLREQFPDVKVVAQEECSRAIQSSKTNKATQYYIYAALRFGESYKNEESKNRKYCCGPANFAFSGSYEFEWHHHSCKLIHSPGHSPGSSIILVDDTKAFTGDTVLNEETFLRFDDGDEECFRLHTLPILQSVGEDVLILPGHGKSFMMRDWRFKWESC